MYKSTSAFQNGLRRSRLTPGASPEPISVFERVQAKQRAKWAKRNTKRAVKTGIGQDKHGYTEPDKSHRTPGGHMLRAR